MIGGERRPRWVFALPSMVLSQCDRGRVVNRRAVALYEAALASPLPLDRAALDAALGAGVGAALADLLDACHEQVDC